LQSYSTLETSFLFGLIFLQNFLIKNFVKISGYATKISEKILVHIPAELRFCLVCSFQFSAENLHSQTVFISLQNTANNCDVFRSIKTPEKISRHLLGVADLFPAFSILKTIFSMTEFGFLQKKKDSLPFTL